MTRTLAVTRSAFRLSVVWGIALVLSLFAVPTFAQEDDGFDAELEGRKTWTIRYGLGSPLGLGTVGLAVGQLALDQTLAVDLRAEALSILTVEGHFDDQQADSLQSLVMYLDTERLHGVFGGFTVDGLPGFSTQRRRMLGGQLEYTLGTATLTAVTARFEGVTETKTFVGETAQGETVFSKVLPDQPWVEQPYKRGIEGLFAYPLGALYVEELSEVHLAIPASAAVRSILTAYGLEYLAEILSEEPTTKLDTASFSVVGDEEQTLLLNLTPHVVIRTRIEDAIDAYNEGMESSGADVRKYPFVIGSEYETSFLDAVANETSLQVNEEDHPIRAAVRRRFYNVGQTGVVASSVTVEVSTDGIEYTPITRSEFAAYETSIHAAAGVLEIDFPDSFFEQERAAIRIRFSYAVSAGSYMLGFSLVPGTERVSVNGVPLAKDDYEIDYEIGLLLLFHEVAETDVILVEYERFGSGLGGVADYARYFVGLNLDLPLFDVIDLTATIQRGLDDPGSVTDPERVRTMPNRQTVWGVLGSVELDDLTGDFALGYGEDVFPPGDNERPSAPNEVTAIAGDARFLFVGHKAGFSVLHQGMWNTYGVAEGLSGQWVRAIVMGGDRVFFGTSSGLTVVYLAGVSPLDQARNWASYTEVNGLDDASIRALLLHEGRLWIGTDAGLMSVDVDEFGDLTAWAVSDFMEGKAVTALAHDGQALYVGTDAGAYRVDPVGGGASPLPGVGGLRIHALASSDGLLYVSSEDGLRTYQNGAGTGWIEWGHPIYAAMPFDDDLYYVADDGLVRVSDGEILYEGWRISAVGVGHADSLWVGSRADAEYVLMLWQHGGSKGAFDNVTTRIVGQDPALFGELPGGAHTGEGLFGRASFEHEEEQFTIRGSIDTVSPGYRAIGGGTHGGNTEWDLQVSLSPWKDVKISGSHTVVLTDTSRGAMDASTVNSLGLVANIGPTLTASVRQEAAGHDPFNPGPETASYVFQSAVADSLFADMLDLSISWSGSVSTNEVDGTSRRQNRLAADAVLALPAGPTFTIDWVRPLQGTAGSWNGRETWSVTGDWSGRSLVGKLTLHALIDASRSLAEGALDVIAKAEADLGLDAFSLAGWRFTPSVEGQWEREEGSTDLSGTAVLRSAWNQLTIRSTLTGNVSGLGDPVTRQNGRLSVSLSYAGPPEWRPTLTYSADQSVTVHRGVGSATSTSHNLTGRSTWSAEGVSNVLSLTGRIRDVAGDRQVIASIEDSHQLDLTGLVMSWFAPGDETGKEAESVFPVVLLHLDATGDYRIRDMETDADLTLAARVDLSLSEMWGASLSGSFLAGTKDSGGFYSSYLFELTVSVDF